MSQELRIASPADKPLRFIAGAFYQHQSNDIFQDYRVDNLAADMSVNGLPGTLWLTKEKRIDRDYAIFGEASFDVTRQITLTGGGRWYKFNNTVYGFAGFGRNPAFFQGVDTDPYIFPNAVNSTKTGVAQCFTASGDTLRESQLNGTDLTLIGDPLSGTPCVNVGRFENGKIKPKQSKDTGWTYRFNGTYKPRDGLMFYATWSKGFRPGGINRQPGLAPYNPDFLVNYELGWKTTFGRLRWNGAVYHQRWQKFQFSFLGENSLTVVQNGRDANIDGIETDINYVRGGLSLTTAAAYNNAKTKGNICDVAADTTADCSTFFPELGSHGTQDVITAPSGTRLPVTPKFKITGTARYSWAMGPGKAHAQIGIVHQGSAPTALKTDDQATLGKLPASTLVDLFAGYEWRNMSFEVFGTNIFDKRNQLSRFIICGSYCSAPEFIHIVPGRPRTIGIRAGMKF
jgi:outer membrane receptor protein involved in Fe transport